VSDDGVGIKSEDTERIFEKFFRSAAVTKTVGGAGLGLAVAREIVVAHGGTLEVESSPGVGSTFVVTVPLHARPTPEPEPEHDLEPELEPEPEATVPRAR
jgi:signal transduction histidine kinase